MHYRNDKGFVLAVEKINSKWKAPDKNAADVFMNVFIELRISAYFFERFFNAQQKVVTQVRATGLIVGKPILDIGLGLLSD